MGTNLLTQSGPYRKAKSTSVVSASFPARIPTITEPPSGSSTVTANTNTQVIDLGISDGGLIQSSAMIVPYGLGADNDACSMRVIGWRSIGSGAAKLWVPTILGAWTAVTLNATNPGIAGAAVINTEFFCDAMTLDTGFSTNNDKISTETVVPGADLIAHCIVALKGSQKPELAFDLTTGTTTTFNAAVFCF